jgi:multidrug efflux pump subunit AcrB
MAGPRPKTAAMLRTESVYQRMLVFNLKHRWLTPVILVVTLASAYIPFTKVDKNFDTSESELFVQVNYDFSENMSLTRKEEFVTRLEKALEPHRGEFKAVPLQLLERSVDHARIYLGGEVNERISPIPAA